MVLKVQKLKVKSRGNMSIIERLKINSKRLGKEWENFYQRVDVECFFIGM